MYISSEIASALYASLNVFNLFSYESSANSLNLIEMSYSFKVILSVLINSYAHNNCVHKLCKISVSESMIPLRVKIVTFSFSLWASALSLLAKSIPNVAGDIIPCIIRVMILIASVEYCSKLTAGWVTCTGSLEVDAPFASFWPAYIVYFLS